MQVARLIRSRFSSSVGSSFRVFHPSSPSSRFSGIANHSHLKQNRPSEPLLHRLFSTNGQLRSLKPLYPAVQSFGRKYQTGTILGLIIATSCPSKWHGLSEAPQCESDQQGKVTAYSVTENALGTEERQEAWVVRWVKQLIVPALVVMTVASGWHCPVSLIVNLAILMWITKPSPASIYDWVEKRRLKQASERRSLDRLKDKSEESGGIRENLSSVLSLPTLSYLWAWQLNPSATVMHVEVRDHMFFCLARVTSLTQNSTMVGLLGDWWVIYSSSSTITTLGLEKFKKDFEQKKEELELEGKRVAEEGIGKLWAWLDKL